MRTILFRVLSSSTPLTQRLADAASQEVLGRHDAAVRAALPQHSGRLKHSGDGIMASFRSAVAAVMAGAQLQRQLTDSGIGVRVGLNAGEPVNENADLFGTTVPLATPITECAAAGQIVASNVVRELCAGKQFCFATSGRRP